MEFTTAELLFMLDTALKAERTSITLVQEHELAKCILALKLGSTPLGFRFRAIVEGWTTEELVRRLY